MMTNADDDNGTSRPLLPPPPPPPNDLKPGVRLNNVILQYENKSMMSVSLEISMIKVCSTDY